MIDLHCHSNYSDGSLSPQELLNKAIANGVKVLAITDHDSVDGVTSLLDGIDHYSIKLIKGIEVSTRWKKHDIHVLGLNIDPFAAPLSELIEKQKNNRLQRALEIAEKMADLGVNHAFEKACKIAGHDNITRPHFAQVFIDEGKARDMPAAFKRFLGRGKPAYAFCPWVSIQEAIDAIHQAQGQAVLAHPLKYGLTRTKLHQLIADFQLAEGDGLEVVSGDMLTTEIQEMAGLCMRFQMLASSGSDYHSDGISRVSLGRQKQLPLNCTPVWQKWNIEQGTL